MGGTNQQWQIVPQGNGNNAIFNVNSGLIIDLDSSCQDQDSCQIRQWNWLGGANQQWQIIPQDSSYNTIVNTYSGKVLDLPFQCEDQNGCVLQQWGSLNTLNKQWEIVPVQDSYQVTGQTNTYYDPTNNYVYAVGSTDQDYSTSYYYGNRISTRIYDNGQFAAENFWGFNTDEQGFGSTFAIVNNPQPGHTYEGSSIFELTTQYLQQDVLSNCGSACGSWYDPFNYTFVIGNPQGTELPTFNTTIWAAPIIIAIASGVRILSMGHNGSTVTLPGPRDYFDLKFRAFIPPAWIYGPPLDFCTVNNVAQLGTIYAGDRRNFDPYSNSYKAHSEVAVSAASGTAVNTPVLLSGVVHRYFKDAIAPDGYTLIGDSILHDCHLLDDVAGGNGNLNAPVTGGGGTVSVNFWGNTQNVTTAVGTGAPSIDWNVTFTVNTSSNPAIPAYTIEYTHDCFPAFEGYIGTQRVYGYKPSSYSSSYYLFCLAGYNQVVGSTIGTVN